MKSEQGKTKYMVKYVQMNEEIYTAKNLQIKCMHAICQTVCHIIQDSGQ